MVVVEDHDGADHAAGHHDHDAGEIGSWSRLVRVFLFILYIEN